MLKVRNYKGYVMYQNQTSQRKKKIINLPNGILERDK
jgi:hypothetical protein